MYFTSRCKVLWLCAAIGVAVGYETCGTASTAPRKDVADSYGKKLVGTWEATDGN